MPPSMRSVPLPPEAAQPVSSPQPKATPSVSVASEWMRHESPAALIERSVRARLVDEFGKALNDAIELSKKMVAKDEAAPINDQTYFYVFDVLAPLIIE